MERHYEIIKTADGSTSVQIKSSHCTFHSVHGAIQESMHVFINAALQYYMDSNFITSINIFEMGFGTGLNALLAAIFAVNNNIEINYYAVDLYPLEKSVLTQMNYGVVTGNEELFHAISNAQWDAIVTIHPHFKLIKMNTSVERVVAPAPLDICFYDAFAPDDQPELWTPNIFQSIFAQMRSGGILSTYCSKSIVRKNLQSVGFTVEKLKGPPGKREILRASKNL